MIHLQRATNFTFNLVKKSQFLKAVNPRGNLNTTELLFSSFLYAIGRFGTIFNHKNFLIMLVSVELMYLGAIASFIIQSIYSNDPKRSAYGLIFLVLAACESAIGLGIIIVLYRFGRSIDFSTSRNTHCFLRFFKTEAKRVANLFQGLGFKKIKVTYAAIILFSWPETPPIIEAIIAATRKSFPSHPDHDPSEVNFLIGVISVGLLWISAYLNLQEIYEDYQRTKCTNNFTTGQWDSRLRTYGKQILDFDPQRVYCDEGSEGKWYFRVNQKGERIPYDDYTEGTECFGNFTNNGALTRPFDCWLETDAQGNTVYFGASDKLDIAFYNTDRFDTATEPFFQSGNKDDIVSFMNLKGWNGTHVFETGKWDWSTINLNNAFAYGEGKINRPWNWSAEKYYSYSKSRGDWVPPTDSTYWDFIDILNWSKIPTFVWLTAWTLSLLLAYLLITNGWARLSSQRFLKKLKSFIQTIFCKILFVINFLYVTLKNSLAFLYDSVWKYIQSNFFNSR